MEPTVAPPDASVTRLREALNGLRGSLALPSQWAAGEPPSAVNKSFEALLRVATEVEECFADRVRLLTDAYAALRDSERTARLVIDNIPGLVALLTATGDVAFVNQQIIDYTGQTLEELRSWGTNGTVHAEDLPHVAQVFTASIATGTPYAIVQRLRRHDGVYRWFENSGFPLRQPDGQILQWCVLLTDVDERKRIEDALRESERSSRQIVDSIPGVLATFTPAGEVETVNRTALDYFGRSFEELQKWENGGATHPDDLPNVIALFTQAIASGGTHTGQSYIWECRTRRYDGVYRWFESRLFPLRNTKGEVIRWYNLLVDIDERKRAEDALRASERDLQLIIDTIPALAWSARPDGSAEFFNRLYLDFVGRSAEEMSGWGWTTSIHPEDLPNLAATWQKIMASGAAGDAEARLLRHTGEYRWFLLRANPLRDESGAIVRWYGVNTDIEDRKRAEDALRASERSLQLTIDTIPTMAWAARPDGSAEFLNRHYLSFIGLTAQQAANWNWTAAVHPEDMPALAAAWQRQVNSEVPGDAEARIRRHDGEYRWFLFRANPFRDESGTILRWYGVNTDIEDRKRAEQQLQRSEAFLLEGQRLAQMGNFLWHLDSADISWTEEMYRMFEFEPGTPLTFDLIASRMHPDDVPMLGEMVERAHRGEAHFEYEHRLMMPDQTVKYVHLIAHRMPADAPGPEYVGAVNDVTRRRLAEDASEKARAELAHVARVATLSTLSASIAHEVNQPLTGIATNLGTCVRMLDADPPNVDGARETARRAIRDAHRAADVMARLRALFSKKEFTLESLSLNEAIQEVIALSRGECQRSRIAVQVELDDGLPRITGDRVQLQQVVLNLLRNAVDAMMTIEDRTRHLLVRTERKGDSLRVTVRDDGVGIDAHAMKRLFEPFYTTKHDGMGIGLSISRSIVERHGGRLWVEQHDGPGATFCLSIPYSPEGLALHRAGD